ncbi:MAG: DUF4007 family protein [Chitinophagales bacterium]|nr:DUF4007 family protein [Chitinophagales bacterium]
MITKNTEIIKFTFSGHGSFQCRQLWLKKGCDYAQKGKNFNDEDAVVQLGVGKNMVSSIRFWLKAFNVIDNKDVPTDFGKRLFDGENGCHHFSTMSLFNLIRIFIQLKFYNAK